MFLHLVRVTGRAVLTIMGPNEGLSVRARAFFVDNLLATAHHKGHKGSIVWDKGIGAELCGTELWHKFHHLGTEMLVTKAGRLDCVFGFFIEMF